MKSMLFNLRIIFRHNQNDVLDELIKLYYKIENILTSNNNPSDNDIKNLITQLNNTTLDAINVRGCKIIYENVGKLTNALYDELKSKNHPSTFIMLVNILNSTCDNKIKERIRTLLELNYTLEYQEYLARRNV